MLDFLPLARFLEVRERSGSQDWQKGLTAYLNADYVTTLQEWTPLAKQGNAPFAAFHWRP